MDTLENAQDEKKPLNSLEETQEDEAQPDPDEILKVDTGSGRIWLIKLPKFLMERWSTVNVEGQHLGTLRLWEMKNPKTGRQFMSIFVPSERDPSVLEEYKLDMVQEAVKNQYVIAEMDKEPSNPANRAKTTIMSGRLTHEVNVRPTYNADYSGRMRARVAAATEPTRQIKRIEDSMGGARGNINMLSSGANQRTSSFDSLVRTSKSRTPGQPIERFTRMAKNQLFDQLFALFKEKPHWSVKDLRLRTEQPESYLKEVLPEIAMQHKSGPQNGLWELLQNYKDGLPMDGQNAMNIDDEDLDEDDEMEEIQ